MPSKILTALFLVGGASALYAGPVYSCGGASACNGNLYAVWVVSQTATSYVLDVGVQVTSSYTGSKTDFMDGLSIIPDTSSTLTSASLTSHPAGVWSSHAGALGASGCQNAAGSSSICAGAIGMGTNLFTYSSGAYIPKTLIWQFTINGTPPSLGDTAFISYKYINNLGYSVGSAGGFNVGIQCVGGGGCGGIGFSADIQAAPEPVTSALVGGGLIALYFLRRRVSVSR
jgi:hypothetical protein